MEVAGHRGDAYLVVLECLSVDNACNSSLE